MRRNLLALTAAILVAACSQGGGDQGDAPATAAPNDADVTFTQNMIPHHQQAIEMANTELRDGSLPEVKRLAQQIIDAQQTEIDQFKQWNKEWTTTNQ